MGRRALPKIDPAIDLSQHLLSLDQLPRPLVSEELFGGSAPLEVEVGSGKGLFLRTAAARATARHFLGIEVARNYARFVAARLARQGLANAKVVHGDAQRLFGEYLRSESVADVHVYFPDPWWKKRHRKRRVLNRAFLGEMVRVLQPGGRFHFWTDVREYYETTLELVAQATRLAGPEDVAERQAEHHLDFRTHFERRTRLAGQPVYRALFRKSPP